MQTKNQISFLRYIILTVLHIGLTFKFYGKDSFDVLIIVFVAILINQICLFVALHELLNKPSDIRDNTKIFILFSSKFIVLAAGLWFGMKNYSGNTLIIIGNYIFQLIILTLSIKRLSKNN
jgi:heme/copper-type cytochrome/quinol oxidase subunit 4